MLIVEKDIENHLRARVEHYGGKCMKFASAAETGIPDRIVVLPKGRIAFVELKRPTGGKLSEIQKYQIDKLKGLGCHVYVVRNYDEVNAFLKDMLGEDYDAI